MVTVYRCVRGELRDVKWQPEDLLLSFQTNDKAVMCVSRQSRRVLPSDCCPVVLSISATRSHTQAAIVER